MIKCLFRCLPPWLQNRSSLSAAGTSSVEFEEQLLPDGYESSSERSEADGYVPASIQSQNKSQKGWLESVVSRVAQPKSFDKATTNRILAFISIYETHHSTDVSEEALDNFLKILGVKPPEDLRGNDDAKSRRTASIVLSLCCQLFSKPVHFAARLDCAGLVSELAELVKDPMIKDVVVTIAIKIFKSISPWEEQSEKDCEAQRCRAAHVLGNLFDSLGLQDHTEIFLDVVVCKLQQDEASCVICSKPFETASVMMLRCGHVIHLECLVGSIFEQTSPEVLGKCRECKQTIEPLEPSVALNYMKLFINGFGYTVRQALMDLPCSASSSSQTEGPTLPADLLSHVALGCVAIAMEIPYFPTCSSSVLQLSIERAKKNAKLEGLVTCKSGHELTSFITPAPGYCCNDPPNGCGKKFPMHADFWSCRDCNWDLCQDCYANEEVRADQEAEELKSRRPKYVDESASAAAQVALRSTEVIEHGPLQGLPSTMQRADWIFFEVLKSAKEDDFILSEQETEGMILQMQAEIFKSLHPEIYKPVVEPDPKLTAEEMPRRSSREYFRRSSRGHVLEAVGKLQEDEARRRSK